MWARGRKRDEGEGAPEAEVARDEWAQTVKELLACQREVQHVLIACCMDLKGNRGENNVVSEGKKEGKGRRAGEG